ncbi:sulfatase [bacterium]|nr:sulfatase [bacterium]
MNKSCQFTFVLTAFLFSAFGFAEQLQAQSTRSELSIASLENVEGAKASPNILWIYIEDMNPSLGCYGDTTVPTPNMDALANRGVLFERCYVTAGVCSPTRSAIITGRMQTTIGAHNHNSAYNNDTPVLLPEYLRGNTLPELFRKNGYETFNQGKDHYNFTYDRKKLYSIAKSKKNSRRPWRDLADTTKPFFGQVQVSGGKYVFFDEQFKRVKENTSTDAAAKTLPPYYPKDPVILKHWAMHYDCIKLTDDRIGQIMADLKADGLLENTIVFCFSDHGCYLPRHKQFCYEGGLHVPLMVVAPNGLAKWKGESRRPDLVSSLDISATSLSFAGIDIPSWYDGKDMFAENFNREVVYAAKDRMDFTIDRVRSLRTSDNFKYIRNFYSDRPYMQLNYRHGREYMVRMEELFSQGKLSSVQARFWSNYRPAEEFYDLNNDPHEIDNLAYKPSHQKELERYRTQLEEWIDATDDKGQYPEDVPNLRFTYKRWGNEKCINPEYDQFRPRIDVKPIPEFGGE